MDNEREITWGLVVESDQVLSATNGKWYTITEIRLDRAGQVVAQAAGVAKPFKPQDPSKSVAVRRGATGKAVDVLQIVFSGEMK